MKTFGEVKVGDKLYSLNYNEWGVLTEHLVTNVIRNDIRSLITIKDVPNVDEICEWFCINQVDNGVKWDNVEKNSDELRKLLKNID